MSRADRTQPIKVAYRLLEAAELTIGQGRTQRSVTILKLVASDYRRSREAAFARRVLDQLSKGQGR